MKKLIFSGLVLILVLAAGGRAALAQVETDKGIQVEKDLMLVRRDLRA